MAPSNRAKNALRNPSYLRVANIIGISNLNSDNDVRSIEDYIRKNGDPYENALNAANNAAKEIREKSVQDLANLTQSFTSRIASMNQAFDTRYRNLEASSAQRYTNLNNVLISQQADFASQRDRLNTQLADQTAAYQEQVKLAEAQARAYVPDANPTATAAAAGDDRANLLGASAKTKQQANSLSNLAVLTGLGTQGNPLSGLQIA